MFEVGALPADVRGIHAGRLQLFFGAQRIGHVDEANVGFLLGQIDLLLIQPEVPVEDFGLRIQSAKIEVVLRHVCQKGLADDFKIGF